MFHKYIWAYFGKKFSKLNSFGWTPFGTLVTLSDFEQIETFFYNDFSFFWHTVCSIPIFIPIFRQKMFQTKSRQRQCIHFVKTICLKLRKVKILRKKPQIVDGRKIVNFVLEPCNFWKKPPKNKILNFFPSDIVICPKPFQLPLAGIISFRLWIIENICSIHPSSR